MSKTHLRFLILPLQSQTPSSVIDSGCSKIIPISNCPTNVCQQSTSVQMQILLDITRISKVLRLTDDDNWQIERNKEERL
jgi:hypothetical protein